MAKVFLAYIPVLHQGYLDFFNKHPDVKTVYLVEESLTHDFRQLVKDIRALHSSVMIKALRSLDQFDEVKIVGKKEIAELNSSDHSFVVPDEDEMHAITRDFLSQANIEWDSIFLRWDKKRSESRNDVQPDVTISRDEFDQEVMQKIGENLKHSSDWWRQVTAALVHPDKYILIDDRNRHLPNDLQAYSDGDPRANFQSGVQIELSTSIHAESKVIAEAAVQGISTKGCFLYCTTFPCQVCAKLIAESGIKKVYYSEGYSALDGENVLKSKGIEIIKVE